ncbi:HNH endonuclease [Calothrix sp. PCC 7507]|uniref:HNH endonuclease n=1 Tax=Calothrix sp. PCC 7507 TaxID=99598 RepID=UPI00029F11D2|nr:HNH endonuclease [Calothrix sp. PCC 7507]AFY33917.1 HNH endonuclease [Calothrix sp. PCC 7507]
MSPQRLVMARLEIEHIIPISKNGSNDESNLWLACPLCNGYKCDKTTGVDAETGETVKLFNPRTQVWSEHFYWSDDGVRIVGKTATGRATVAALHLSEDADALEVRSYWVLAGWHLPED